MIRGADPGSGEALSPAESASFPRSRTFTFPVGILKNSSVVDPDPPLGLLDPDPHKSYIFVFEITDLGFFLDYLDLYMDPCYFLTNEQKWSYVRLVPIFILREFIPTPALDNKKNNIHHISV